MKLKTTHALAVCALSLLNIQPVWAAIVGPDIKLTVGGTITPGPCSVNLGGRGVGEVTYGNIAGGKIQNVSEGTDLGVAPTILPLVVECPKEAIRVGLSLTDNAATSRVNGLTVLSPNGRSYTSGPSTFGLGTSNGRGVGSYVASISNPRVDGKNAKVGRYNIDTHAVGSANDAFVLFANEFENKNIITWLDDGTTNVASGNSFMGDIKVRATINKASELDLTQDVKLEGNATLTVYYL